MKQGVFKVRQKFWKDRQMSQACSPADVQRFLKEGWTEGPVSERIRKAHRDLGWAYERTWNYWYGKVRRVDPNEAFAWQAWKEQRAVGKSDAQVAEIQELRKERDAISQRLDRMEALLSTLVSGLASAPLSEVKPVIRSSRGSVDAGNGRDG